MSARGTFVAAPESHISNIFQKYFKSIQSIKRLDMIYEIFEDIVKDIFGSCLCT